MTSGGGMDKKVEIPLIAKCSKCGHEGQSWIAEDCLSGAMKELYLHALEAARFQEREAAVKIVEDHLFPERDQFDEAYNKSLRIIVAAIRRRGGE